VDDVDAERARARIAHEHEETTRLVGALTIELNAIIDSVALSNNDDEHDPDGATSGYERAKATAMLQHAEARLVELDRAADRIREGSYGFCERCGGEIGRDRLDALIATTRCRPCAAESRPRSG
jgi:DnaK suppressor protein